ncbi:MAG TPA: hypothetical protein VIO11_10310, partial [Candidatus Methanoperedens sp.]
MRGGGTTKKIKTLFISFILLAVMMGAADADGTVDITSTASIDPATGSMLLPSNQNVYKLFNLQAEYEGWKLPGTYHVEIREGL